MGSIGELLKKIQFSDLEIKSLMDLRDRMKINSINITSNISDKVSGSKNLTPMEDKVIRYLDLEKTINEKVSYLFNLKQIALNSINSLENPLERVILIERYFNHASFKSISITVERSERRVRDIHDKALKRCIKLPEIS